MKLSKSKLALAKVINENGGWVDDSANWAAQPKHEGGDVMFSTGENKPYREHSCDWFTFDGVGSWLDCSVHYNKVLPNWHQCVLSRGEYYQAYPKADADGWIEWNGGDCPVGAELVVDVNYRDGGNTPTTVKAGSQRWNHSGLCGDIISYRMRRPAVDAEFCESVTRSIPEPNDFELECDPSLVKLSNGRIGSESIDELCAKVTEENKHQHIDAKPTIEHLAQDYRNAKDHADRLQKEAGEAAVKAESFAVEIRKKILELQELIG